MTPEEFKKLKESKQKGRKAVYPFATMQVGDVVRLNTQELGKRHAQLISAAHAYSSRKTLRFETTRDGDDVVVYRAE